ncbi:MAG: hypothetical protein ABIY50_04105 [Ignavibacteria bacterium]
MTKKKELFIKKNLRPDLEIDPDKKIGDLTVRELSAIVGADPLSKKEQSNLIGGTLKRILDSKPFKDYKDNKDLIYEGPLVVKNYERSFEELIERISGLENEIKKLKKK